MRIDAGAVNINAGGLVGPVPENYLQRGDR